MMKIAGTPCAPQLGTSLQAVIGIIGCMYSEYVAVRARSINTLIYPSALCASAPPLPLVLLNSSSIKAR